MMETIPRTRNGAATPVRIGDRRRAVRRCTEYDHTDGQRAKFAPGPIHLPPTLDGVVP